MKIKQIVSNILMVLLAVSLISTNASAHVSDNLWNVSGWVIRSDTGAGMAGLTVSNASNASQTTTTNASGGFILNVTNTTYASNTALSVTATAGYTRNTSVTYTVTAADNASKNVTLIVITPTISAVTETTPTVTADTVSWTVTATDGLNNNYVGNRVLYSTDSNLATNYFYSAWSNDTTSPSFPVTNLRINTKYYYQLETYNQLNSAYSATTTGDFTTKGGVSSTYGKPPAPGTTTPKSIIPGVSGKNNNGLIVLGIIGVVAYVLLFSGGKKGKGKKR